MSRGVQKDDGIIRCGPEQLALCQCLAAVAAIWLLLWGWWVGIFCKAKAVSVILTAFLPFILYS